MQVVERELSAFVKREIAFRARERNERAARLGLSIGDPDAEASRDERGADRSPRERRAG